MNSWTALDDETLTEFLLQTSGTLKEFANKYGFTLQEVSVRMKELGLSWVNVRARQASRGEASLMKVMQKLLPGEKIVTEEPIGERLRLDVYCPSYKLAAEFHGRQHFEYVEYFHQDIEGFKQSQRRDERKIEICRDLGIALIVFRYNDDLSETVVFERMLEAIRSTPIVPGEKRKTLKGDPYYESFKQRQREFRRESYRKMRGAH
jgi:hypothetical protein